MPIIDDNKPVIKLFHFHGILTSQFPDTNQAIADCPFCGREGKFYINTESGKWDCFTGETRVLTEIGYKSIKELVGTNLRILSHKGWSNCTIKSYGKRKVFKVYLTRDTNKKVIKATYRHRWIMKSGAEKVTMNLRSGDRLAHNTAPTITEYDIEGVRHGIIYGDGSKNSLELYGDKIGLLNYMKINGKITQIFGVGVDGIRICGDFTRYKSLPDITKVSKEYLLGFIMGYFSTDGTTKAVSARIDSANKESIEFIHSACAVVGLVCSPVKECWRKGFEGYEGNMYYIMLHRSTLTPKFFLRKDQELSFLENGEYGNPGRLSWRVEKIEECEQEEEVYCAEVPEYETFTLEDNLLTGNCKRCGAYGNPIEFIRQLYNIGLQETKEEDFVQFASERKYITTDALKMWGACKHIIRQDEWLYPGYYHGNEDLKNLYRYTSYGCNKPDGKHVIVTPRCNEFPSEQCLFGVDLFDDNKPDVYLCEGHGDAIALYEILSMTKINSSGNYEYTGNISSSLLSRINVVGIPGVNIFKEHWIKLFAGKRVFLLLDNDHPLKHPKTGKLMEPAARAGLKRLVKMFSLAEDKYKPSEVFYLAWSDKGTHDPLLKHGYDVRDLLSEGYKGFPTTPSQTIEAIDERSKQLYKLVQMLKPIPHDWIDPTHKLTNSSPKKKSKDGKLHLSHEKCESWNTLVSAWKEAMVWHPGLEKGLACMLATVTSTMLQGDQLWMKIISPPSSGKSVLCDAICTNRNYVISKSDIRGFFSGFKQSNEEKEKSGKDDLGLAADISGKTFVTKDGDTLLQSTNKEQILAQARKLYDGDSSTHFKNGIQIEYANHRTTWLLSGTESLRSLDTSELGERFLDCVIIDEMTHAMELDIAERAALEMLNTMSRRVTDNPETMDSHEKVIAKKLTAGYIDYLRENADDDTPGSKGLVSFVKNNTDPRIVKSIAQLADFTSYMRSRPSYKQEEKAQKELCVRLAKQLMRLANCLAVVMNRTSIDSVVMSIVSDVAFDTSRGIIFDITKLLYNNLNGFMYTYLRTKLNQRDNRMEEILRFMRRIGGFTQDSEGRYTLTKSMRSICEKVFGD